MQQSFMQLCRAWRLKRNLSQLDLALAADISQRHLSYLETGRSQPSRNMIERLSAVLEIPLRARNDLLSSAGFTGQYQESQLCEPYMKPVFNALTLMLSHHDPLPAVVLDRHWNVVLQNRGADYLFSLVFSELDYTNEFHLDGKFNLAIYCLHDKGLRTYTQNWAEVSAHLVRRINASISQYTQVEFKLKISQLIERMPVNMSHPLAQIDLLPVLPLQLSLGDIELRLFSLISTFGSAQDITADELKIESFYPSDEKSTAFFKQLNKGQQNNKN
ncbi:helix-turn-helix domain-containing protein [Flavobacterium sp. W21_SRS_FM6]|uniref:helix-turn-helix domain-containing protein n=1 Tax=Flavobacterium sp. W21_SRS_FM6 TaxID=3240268 RepID=UPI003F932F36